MIEQAATITEDLLEGAGVPLKNWNVEMYRGVLTGYNDAFIITSENRLFKPCRI